VTDSEEVTKRRASGFGIREEEPQGWPLRGSDRRAVQKTGFRVKGPGDWKGVAGFGLRACSVYVLRAARKAQRTASVRPEIVMYRLSRSAWARMEVASRGPRELPTKRDELRNPRVLPRASPA